MPFDCEHIIDSGLVYTKLGEIKLAIEWSAKAFDERNAFIFAGAAFPGLERLASDPAYAALLNKARSEHRSS